MRGRFGNGPLRISAEEQEKARTRGEELFVCPKCNAHVISATWFAPTRRCANMVSTATLTGKHRKRKCGGKHLHVKVVP